MSGVPSGHLDLGAAPGRSLEGIVPVRSPTSQDREPRRSEVQDQVERPETAPLAHVLAFVGEDVRRNLITGEDVPAQGLGRDRHQMGAKPALDARVLDQVHGDVADVHLARRMGDAAAAHDEQTQKIAR